MQYLRDDVDKVMVAVNAVNEELDLQQSKVLGIDLEWDSHNKDVPLSLMQAAVGGAQVHMFDAVNVPVCDVLGEPKNMKALLSDPSVVIVVHAASGDKSVLRKRGVYITSLFDTQIAHEILEGGKSKSLKHVVKSWLGVDISKGAGQMKRFMMTQNAWSNRPLPDFVLEYAADDVRHLPALHAAMHRAATEKGTLDLILKASLDSKVLGDLRKERATSPPTRPTGGAGGATSGGPPAEAFATDANGCRSVTLRKLSAATKLGIVLVDSEVVQTPVIKELKAGLAAVSGELHVGDSLLKINGQPCVLGHVDASQRLKEAIGDVVLDVLSLSEHARQQSGWQSTQQSSGPADKTTDSFVAFGKELMANEALRSRCVGAKQHFAHEFKEWKKHEHDAGRPRRGSPSDALYFLAHAKSALRGLHGLPRVKVTAEGVSIAVEAGSAAEQRAAAGERVNEDRERVEANKNGIEVSTVAFEDVIGISEVVERAILVSNTSSLARRMTAKLVMSSRPDRRGQAPAYALAGVVENVPLPPGAQHTFILKACPTSAGLARDILSLVFGGFTIGRYLEARCGDAELLNLLKPRAQYVKQRKKKPLPPDHMLDIVNAPKPETGGATPTQEGPRLKPYQLVTSSWRSVLISRPSDADYLLMVGHERMHELRAGTADVNVQRLYAEQQSRLLYTEEMQLVADLRSFDFEGEDAKVLTKRGGLLWLHVPGLAEKRPSVLKGDRVHVKYTGGGESAKRFEGVADSIEQQQVGLRFSPAFSGSYIAGQRVDVHFVLGRRPLRLFHQGLEQTKGLPMALLFPERSDLLDCDSVVRPLDGCARPYNRDLNEEQQLAVRSIVAAEKRDVPYVLFGPPGTGKTTTLVEAVLQLAVQLPKVQKRDAPLHILVCTPTNTAADHICTCLAKVLSAKCDMLRLVAYSRSKSDFPPNFPIHLTNWDGDGFEMPPLEDLLKPTVVVATLTKASALLNVGVRRGHFTSIVLDEGGQAFEAEAIAPVGCLLGPDGQLVVAGDPKQLGPVVHHALAKEHGLGLSYLERLMERPIYQKEDRRASSHVGQYDARVITKLVRNYRSHAALIELPNRLFYDGDLVSSGDPMVINNCAHYQGLPTVGVPLLWHGIIGADVREARSPSWFNPDEAIQVVSHVKDLLAMRHNRLKPSDIGVITPYNQQVHRIRMALRSASICDVKVGSTEMFQGQERRVIILSTVRSSQEWVDFDANHNLGFLDNPKRFNVAITRAQALLIIVGNPNVLASDYHWRELLKLCVAKGAYMGVPLPDLNETGEDGAEADDAAMADLVDDLEQLVFNDDPDEDEWTLVPSEPMLQEVMEMPSHE